MGYQSSSWSAPRAEAGIAAVIDQAKFDVAEAIGLEHQAAGDAGGVEWVFAGAGPAGASDNR